MKKSQSKIDIESLIWYGYSQLVLRILQNLQNLQALYKKSQCDEMGAR